jgi:3-hydroxyacyl-CoA dehydrogenase
MKHLTIKKVAVVATGVIGASWAAHFLAQGLDVSATDPSPGAEDRLRAAVEKHWPTMELLGLAPGAAMDRLAFSAQLEEAIKGVDFVQESGPERIEFKADLFMRMDALLPPEVILASSSSGLSTTEIQATCIHAERVVLGHPFNPPHLIPLVEVIGGERTSTETIERTLSFYKAIGKHPVHGRREIKGHIANRLQAALWREAFHLVDQGIATVEDIDATIAFGPGLRWGAFGPFLNLHFSGGAGGIQHVLDHLGGPIEAWWDDLGSPSMTDALKAKVAQGMAEALHGKNLGALEAARDQIVVQLIRAKASS